MGQDFEQLLREIFGESWNRLSQFQADQLRKLNAKVHEIAREAVKDEIAKLHAEINELRTRVTTLEAERAESAAESLESSF